MNRNAILSVIALTIVASTASAATFVVRPDRDLVHRADAVVVASALTSYSVLNEAGGVETVTVMSAEEVIKGDVESSFNVVEPGGVYKNSVTIVGGAPQFTEGRRMLLFLMMSGPGRWSVLDLVVGKFTFAEDRLGQKLLVRDESEVQGWDPDLQPHRERRRSAERFLEWVRTEAHGRTAPADYAVPAAELSEPPLAPSRGPKGAAPSAMQPAPLVAPYTATSYTMLISGSLGSRWNVFPNGVSVYRGTTQEPGAPGGGTAAVQAALASWDNDCASNVNYVYAGVDDGTHTQGLHGPDGRNTVLFERDLSAWGIPPFSCSSSGYSGTLGIGGITSAGGSNTVGGETFVTTNEADVEMNSGLANCTLLFNSGDFNSAVTHEVGHTLGFRHADQTRSGNAACSTDASLECASQAIMTAFVTQGINAALQTWDMHAVQAVYPGSCNTCRPPTVSISASATTITAGQSVTINSTTTGSPTGYQWYIGTSGNTAQPIAGQTNPSLTVSPTTTTSYWLRVTNACGSANSNTVTITVNAPPPPPANKAKSDFNGDGKSDLVLQNSSTSGITVWLMNGTGPATGAQIAAPVGWAPVATGDVDGDGHADVIVRNTASGQVSVYLMGADGLTTKGFNNLASPTTQYQVITTADFNRDGTDDIVLQNTVTGVVSLWLMRAGTILSGYVLQTPDASWRVLASGDLDADGWPDLVLQNLSSNAVTVWRTQNGTVVAGQVINVPASNWKVIAAGDVNGDGRDDIILQDQTGGVVTVWIMNGFAITNGHVVGAPPASRAVKGRGDFNGDGTYDIVLQDSSTKGVYVWLISGGFVSVEGPPTVPASVYNLMVNR